MGESEIEDWQYLDDDAGFLHSGADRPDAERDSDEAAVVEGLRTPKFLLAELSGEGRNDGHELRGALLCKPESTGLLHECGIGLVDADGVVGQVIEAGVASSQCLLISDPGHDLPVEVNRNGLRTIARGTGEYDSLDLPFLPNNADIEPGDLLVHDALTIHRADGNHSPTRSRQALGFVYFGESARIDEEARTAYQEQLTREMKDAGKI